MRGPYAVRFSHSARRALTGDLAETVATAAFEFITGALADNPRRLEKQLHELRYPLYSVRRGEYRVICRIEDGELLIDTISVVHRRDTHIGRNWCERPPGRAVRDASLYPSLRVTLVRQ